METGRLYNKRATTIAVANNKGGTGKTATAVTLAAAFRLMGYNVLIVDNDGQANATAALGVRPTMSNLYTALISAATPKVTPTRVAGEETNNGRTTGVLDILPSTENLVALEREIPKADRTARLARLLEKYRYDFYDFIVIDNMPSVGDITLSALVAADAVIVPVVADALSLVGFQRMADLVARMDKTRGTRTPVAALVTRFDKRLTLARMALDKLVTMEADGRHILHAHIRENVAVGEAMAAQTDIFSYDAGCNAAEDYMTAAREWMAYNDRI